MIFHFDYIGRIRTGFLHSKKKYFFKLNTEKHPFWEHAIREIFLAEKNGSVVGRIAAIIDDNYNELWDEHMGTFGFFELIDDLEVAKALFDAAYTWLKEHGADKMRGTLSPSQNDECAFLLEGYDSPPVMMMSYNPPYYLTLTEKLWFFSNDRQRVRSYG